MATLNGLMTAGVEELRIIQTMLLLVTSTDVVQGKSLTKVRYISKWVSRIEGVNRQRFRGNMEDF